MSDNRENEEFDSQSYLKSAQLYTSITQYFSIPEVDGILQNAGNINYRFPSNSCLKSHQPKMIGSTILHFAINYSDRTFDIFELLLKYGADYTVKNDKGSTALHHAVEIDFDKCKDSWKWKSELANKYVAEILSRQVRSRNAANPCSSDGMSHFHVACITNDQEAVSFFLESGTSVDQAVDIDAHYFPGYTSLHFAVRFCAVETVEMLLRFHAKVDIQDARGMTPMHVAIERKIEILDLINIGEQHQHNNLSADMQVYEKITKLLVKSSDFGQGNFVDSIGLTYFHIACTMKHTSMAKKCLKQIDDIDQFVKFDSPIWPGYTALHLAALFNVKIVVLLLKNGANIEAKDANGISPFDICLEFYQLVDVHSILSNHPIWKDIMFSDGKTSLLDVIMDMSEPNVKVELGNMNIFIPFDSSLWPGYTPLHVAVVFAHRIKDASNYELSYHNDYHYNYENEENTVKWIKTFKPKFLIKNKYLAGGVTLNAQDAYGSTPLHLAFRLQKTRLINSLIEYNINVVKNSVDDVNLSHLHIAAAMNNAMMVTNLLKKGAAVDMQVHTTFKYLKSQTYGEDSMSFVISKGSTALHIAAAANNYESMRILLEYRANVKIRDVNGMTPIHRQIMPQKYVRRTGQMMLNSSQLKNCVDDSCNLSHLHVASCLGEEKAIKSLLKQGADINAAVKCANSSDESLQFLSPYVGFTPLHFALKYGTRDACELLIKRGADIFAQSSNGVPLLYEGLTSNKFSMFFSILEKNKHLRRKMFEQTGLTMLHLACYKLDQQWENFGRWLHKVDINARSHCDSPLWPGCTPLDVLISRFDKYDEEPGDHWYIDTLFEEGFLENEADITLVNGSNTTALLEVDRLNRAFKEEIIPNYESDEPQELCMCERYSNNYSEGLPGEKRKVKCIWNKSSRNEDEKVPYSSRLSILLDAHKDFNVNPANAKGISHFHVACLYKCYDVVKNFLKHNVDINSVISLFSDEFPGCTPLHLTMIHSVDSKLTQVLLDHGADVHSKDAYGNTPLHFAAKNSKNDLELFQMIINKEADINARNLFGKTSLDIILNSYSTPVTVEVVEFFLKRSYRVNNVNPVNQEGWIPYAFWRCNRSSYYGDKGIYATILSAPELIALDDFGRTPIHNLSSYFSMSTDGIKLLKTLSKGGCNVDHQDVIGRSALHIAVQFTNVAAVTELLKLGADINLRDSNGKVPFAYCFEASTLIALRRFFNNRSLYLNKNLEINSIIIIFVEHIRKLELARLDVCRDNLVVLSNLDYEISVDCSRFCNQLERSKQTEIQYEKSSFILHDLLSETNIVSAYPNMLQTKRRVINKFFKSDDIDIVCKELDELFGFLKLQYKKAVERGRLIGKAFKCLNVLAKFPVPYVCSDIIIKHLSNMDLKNLNASVNEELLHAPRRF